MMILIGMESYYSVQDYDGLPGDMISQGSRNLAISPLITGYTPRQDVILQTMDYNSRSASGDIRAPTNSQRLLR